MSSDVFRYADDLGPAKILHRYEPAWWWTTWCWGPPSVACGRRPMPAMVSRRLPCPVAECAAEPVHGEVNPPHQLEHGCQGHGRKRRARLGRAREHEDAKL